jgi:phosphoheptose isomerase
MKTRATSHRKRRLTAAVLSAVVATPPTLAGVQTIGPVGDEFQVNTYTTDYQRSGSAAMDADGDFVVAWASYGQDGGVAGIFAQRYNAAGVGQGTEFRVNTYTAGYQDYPAVAMDADGDFVATWTSYGQDGSGDGVYAQRYNAAGVAQGTEFQVNTYTTDGQIARSVAMDANGDFVVAWTSYYQDRSYAGVYAQRYNAAGVAQGSEFQVNSYETNDQAYPAVAMDADGDFVVAWQSDQEGAYGGYGVYARRYNAAGVAQGTEFQINTYTSYDQAAVSVAMDADGDFVVAWQSLLQDLDSHGIYAQRYNAAGVAQGSEFRVNTYITSGQTTPSAAMDVDGDFVVTWTSSGQDGSGDGVYGQLYNAAGVAKGSEFRVNTYTTINQRYPSAAMDADGDFVVVWRSSPSQDGDSYGVYAQRYLDGTGPDFSCDKKADIPWRNTSSGENALWLMDGLTRTDSLRLFDVPGTTWDVVGVGDFDGDCRTDLLWRKGNSGDNAIWETNTDPAFMTAGLILAVSDTNWTVAATGDFNADGSSDILWRNMSDGNNALWLMDGFSRSGAGNLLSVGTSWTVAGVDDFDHDGMADILWRNTGTGQNAVWLMDGTSRVGAGNLQTVADTNWTVAGVGDLDGDGRADIVWRNVSDGHNAVWFMNGTARTSAANLLTVADTDWQIEVVADYDGDGKADLLWRNATSGANAIWLMDGAVRVGSGNLIAVGTNWDTKP